MTRIFLGIAFASLSVVACGSDDSAGSGGGATSAANTSAATNGAGGMTSTTTGGPSSTVGNGPATTTGAGGSGPGSGGAGGSTGMGACTNPADQAILMSKDVEAIAAQCGQDNLGADAATKMCIKMQTGLSDGCVDCFGATIQCAVMNCIGMCFGMQDSPECQMCLATNCIPAFETCSGLMM